MAQNLRSIAFTGRTKFEQTVWFHVLAAALIAVFAGLWFKLHYFTFAGIDCLLIAILSLNLWFGFTRIGTQTRFASIGVLAGAGAICVGVIAASRQVPLMVSFFVFPPLIGVALCGGRTLLRWSVGTLVAMVISTALAFATDNGQTPLSPMWISMLNIVIQASLVALASLVLFILSQDHETFAVSQTRQNQLLQLANTQLTNAQNTRDRFFASASHELRTPINAITGIAELLRTSPRIDTAEEPLIAALNTSSQHLLSIINDLLDLSKLKENKLQLVQTDFDVRKAVSAAFSIVQNAQRLHRLPVKRLRLHVAAALPPRLHGDGRRLTQILLNLLNNAVKFTPAGEVALLVRGRVSEDGTTCRCAIEVRDTGIGMSAETLEHLFDDYRQADATIAATFGGTGLGLSICKRLLDLMGGSIEVSSAVGQGSIFKIKLTFPVGADRAAAAPSSPPFRLAASPGAPKIEQRILIVDDNNLNLLIAKKLIERRFPDVIVETADHGAMAVERVEQTDFDLVLMDMQMPVMDGIQATHRIRTQLDRARALVPIVAMSANSDPSDIARCLEAGMNDAVCKPVDPKLLNAVVAKFLQVSELQRSGTIVIPVGRDFNVSFPSVSEGAAQLIDESTKL